MSTPPSWDLVSLEEIAAGGLFSDGDWVESKDQDPTGDVRLTQLADVGVATFRDRSDRWMRADQAERLRCTYLRPGDVLIARMPEPIGRACVVPDAISRSVTAVDVAILRITRPDVDRRYAMWALNSPFAYEAMVAVQSGTTRKRIARRKLGRITIPLPPIDEQRRIVDILEDHLSRLDAATVALTTAERRLGAWESAYLSSCYASAPRVPLASVSEIQGGIQKQPKRAPQRNAYPFLRVANVTARGLDLTEVHTIELFDGELERLALRSGDLLVVEGNGSASQIGRAATWDGSIVDCVHQNHLIRVRPTDRIRPEFLEAIWNAPENREILSRVSSSSSGLHTLSVAKLKSLTVPLPAGEVQAALCAQVSEVRAARRRVADQICAARKRGESLRRSLLQAAFSGRLTARTSDDELEGLVPAL